MYAAAAEDAYSRWSRESGDVFTKILEDLRHGSDPREGAGSSNHWATFARDYGDPAKADAASKGIQLAAAILSTRDLTINTDEYPGRMPPFDYAKYGAVPFWTIVDPARIEDPSLRAAYSEALARHKAFLRVWGKESSKQREADYCLGCVQRLLDGASRREVVEAAVLESIGALHDEDWIKDYIRSKLFPKPTPEASTVPAAEPVIGRVKPAESAPAAAVAASSSRTTATPEADEAEMGKREPPFAPQQPKRGRTMTWLGWSSVALVVATLAWLAARKLSRRS